MTAIYETDDQVYDDNGDVTGPVRLVPTSVSDVLDWTPELVVIVVFLAFAGAFSWPPLALVSLLAALRIVGSRAYRSWSNARVLRQHAAAQAAARVAAEATRTDEAPGGETR